MHSVLTNCCGLWKSSLAADIDIRRLATANSNYVFAIRNRNNFSVAESEPEMVLFRVYGKMNVMFERAEEERVAMALAEMGVVRRFYAVFKNGRIEPFIHHSPLSAVEFRGAQTAYDIVQRLRKIHNLLPSLMIESHSAPVDKMWQRLETLHINAVAAQTKLLDRALDVDGRSEMLNEIVEWNIFQDYSAVKARALESRSLIVFGHCDMHHGNVLRTPEGLLIIDFEYALPTARGFDFANYFCEFCSDYDVEGGHEVSYELYPSFKDRMGIFRAYLGPDASEDDLLKLEHETECYLPFVHLQWAHWGLVKAQDEYLSSFDFLRYAYLRYTEWKRLTARFV